MLTTEEILEKHRKLKEKQDSLEPFLTFEMMKEVLGYSSLSAVQNLLDKMVKLGLAEKVPFGDISRYRILKKS